MPDELKEIPQSGLQQLTGRLGQGMQKIGRTVEEAITPLQQTHPIRSALSNLLISSPLQSAGAALQDWSGTPRNISEDYPYRARLFDPKQPAMVDPRILDVSQFAGPVVSRARNAARFAIPDLKAAAIAAYGPQATAAHVVKPKGGNWLSGSVEQVIDPLKITRQIMTPEKVAEQKQSIETARRILGDRAPQATIEQMEREIQQSRQGTAINQWIDRNLANYIKKQMATPEDPVRKLAEQGIVHMPPEQMGLNATESNANRVRERLGTPRLGRSPEAQAWEDATDVAINPLTIKDVRESRKVGMPWAEWAFEPWMKEADPQTKIFRPTDNMHAHYLGFDHIVDELKNAINPLSGLPRELQIKPESLSKLSMSQAVERVAKINAWREAQKAEANAARAMNPATVVHREYPTIPGTDLPNERGLRWVEMRAPEELPAGWREETREGRQWFFDPEGKAHNVDSDPRYASLQDALKYEGDTMGHCVGGYCPDVASGKTRIYSLRDAKGQPHVTIEVRPHPQRDLNLSSSQYDKLLEDYSAAVARGEVDPNKFDPKSWYLSQGESLPPRIIQIKGKGNRKPNEEYLPFVQDFVQSGQWSDVGDIHNAEMFKLPDNRFVTRKRVEEAIARLSNEDSPKIGADWLVNQIRSDPSWWNEVKPAFDEPTPTPRQYRKGGLIQNPTLDAMQMQVWDKALRRQIGGASEPTQAEIEAAMRPETVNPRLRALANKAKTQPGIPITDRLVGAGEAAASLASGILGSIPAGYEGMAELLRSRDPARAAQAVETGLQRYTYQPRTPAGVQEAQAGAHLLEKLDAPSQYVGNYMLEQTRSPAAATAAQIILDPLNFLPGPKQLASTVRGVPQMLQDAAIQAYGPSATASYVVPPHGNLNLTPQIAAETLKGPDRQPIGNFLKQLQGTPGVTKEGLAEGLAATKILDPTAVVTKAEFEKYITPSKYEKFEIERDPTNSEYYQGLLEHAIDDVHDEFQNMPAFDYLGYEMGIPPRYAEDFNTLVQQTNMPHFADATSLSELEAYGIPRELITLLERNGITTPDAFDRAIDDLTRQAINEQAEVRVAMHIAEEDEPINFSNVQRLVDEDSAAALPFTAYQEIGVRHPNQQGDYRHFPGQRNMIGHFRGTMVPADSRHGVKLADELGTVPPGTFLIEEIQSDVQQSGDMTKHLHQVHGTVAKAAIQHALEQGAHTIYVPTSFPIAEARAGASDNTMQMLRRVYDKEVPSQAIEPLRKIPGVTITTAIPILSPDPKDPKFMFHVLRFTNAAREHILRGPGQKAPGYAKGGRVTNDAMWMAVQNKQLRKKHGN